MITLILAAVDVPEGYTVRKPTGEKEYRLFKKLPVYGLAEMKEIQVDPSIVFLVAETGVNAIPGNTKLALDFDRPSEASGFIDNHLRSHK